MGHSETINVIGFSAPEEIEPGKLRRYECYAMNKMEMAQKAKVMADKNLRITGWFAQTNAGCKMLGNDAQIWEEIPDCKVKHVKLIKCPICNGMGTIPQSGKNFMRSCVICNGSGITRKGYWLKWQEWQLESIRLEFAV